MTPNVACTVLYVMDQATVAGCLVMCRAADLAGVKLSSPDAAMI